MWILAATASYPWNRCHMSIKEIASFKLMIMLDADEDHIRAVVKRTNHGRGGKKRFIERTEFGQLYSLAAAQGHSEAAHSQLDDEVHLTRVSKKDLPRICLHGTIRKHIASIQRTGLRPGGDRGIQHRAHVHIVEYLSTTGESSGVPGGSDVIV